MNGDFCFSRLVKGKGKIFFLVYSLFIANTLKGQFISEVVEYRPAPGQYINEAPWGMPDDNNPDVSIVGRLDGAMSLGAFGGYVIFKFAEPVKNHPDNPYGIDFVIYGNPIKNFTSSPVPNRVSLAEPAAVYVMKDENKNGLPDDQWYELAGSDYFFSSTIKNYEVTYTNPNSDIAADIPWNDNLGNSGFIPANSFHTQPYYPESENFPAVDQVKYTVSGTLINHPADRSNPSFITAYGRPWGYADNTLRGRYNGLPDNPYTRGMDLEEEGSGGDAFDIGWAVNANGEYMNLDEIDFVKVQNCVLVDGGMLGELSTEITGAFVVTPDASVTGELDMIVIKELPDTIRGENFQIEAFAYNKGRWNRDKSINWSSSLTGASVDNTNLLTFTSSGKLTLTASLSDRPEIKETVSSVIVYGNATSTPHYDIPDIKVYPNPVSENIFITGVDNVTIEIYNILGNRVILKQGYSDSQPVPVAHLANGIYIVRIYDSLRSKNIRFIKK